MKKKKSGRSVGKTDSKRRQNSPPVNAWEEKHGVTVPQTGLTVFASEARDDLREIIALLCESGSWDTPEAAETEECWKTAQPLPALAGTEPWKYVEAEWVFNWLDSAEVRLLENKIYFSRLAVRLPEGRLVMHLHSSIQTKLIDFALSQQRFAAYALRAFVEKGPQGFILEPKSLKQREVFGRDAFIGLAEMLDEPRPDKKRSAFRKTAEELRRAKLRKAHARGLSSYFAAQTKQISFRELVEKHTGFKLSSLEITDKTRLEELRRYAREFSKAGADPIRISFR